jgi:sugar/nucleoside kinase (ribokinase family)
MARTLAIPPKWSTSPLRRWHPVDSTGAGDVFSGGFLAGFAEGLPIAESIRYGICAAALSTTRIGVIESIPSRAVTIEFATRADGGR